MSSGGSWLSEQVRSRSIKFAFPPIPIFKRTQIKFVWLFKCSYFKGPLVYYYTVQHHYYFSGLMLCWQEYLKHGTGLMCTCIHWPNTSLFLTQISPGLSGCGIYLLVNGYQWKADQHLHMLPQGYICTKNLFPPLTELYQLHSSPSSSKFSDNHIRKHLRDTENLKFILALFQLLFSYLFSTRINILFSGTVQSSFKLLITMQSCNYTITLTSVSFLLLVSRYHPIISMAAVATWMLPFSQTIMCKRFLIFYHHWAPSMYTIIFFRYHLCSFI
jgi:hypothetical protein